MSENSTPEERTEMPTSRRRGEIRKEGRLYLSTDLNSTLTLLTAFLLLEKLWSWIFHEMKVVMLYCFEMISRRDPFTMSEILLRIQDVFVIAFPPLIALVIGIAIVGTLATLLQTGFNIKEKKIHFQFNMLNPIGGLKRIFSINGFVNVAKAILKLSIILPLAFFSVREFAPEMIKLIHLQVLDVFHFTGATMGKVFWKIFYILFMLAIIDYFWGKHQWLKQVKMTKQEVKDEAKATEGDEASRRRIVMKGMQRMMQRLQKSVPKADVIITNPTHFAVALEYNRDKMRAPTVVAKGADFLALRIREIAKEHGVPIVERKSLARALYDGARVGAEIPYPLFKAVAEVLAYVYRIKGKAAQKTAAVGKKVATGFGQGAR
jgi:flagellar biosynthetic protein FlhB